MNKTITEATVSMQSDAQQELTQPVVTEHYSTPTLTFGEVGQTTEVTIPTYDMALAHGVGDFMNTELLERAILIGTYTWTTSGPLAYIDVDLALRQNARNWAVMSQFYFYRADIEVTVRLNTNQFYYGALMVTLFPGSYTVSINLDENSIFQPHVISASSAESVIKTSEYFWPQAWVTTKGIHPTTLLVYAPTLLKNSNESSPEGITVSVWARYKNIKLSWPGLQGDPPATPLLTKDGRWEPQSADGKLVIKRPKKQFTIHPVDSTDLYGQTVEAISSIAAEGVRDGVKSLASMVSGIPSVIGALSILDKPDDSSKPTCNILEASRDAFVSDIADSNVFVGLYKDRYTDPGMSRMPLTSAWTISRYAQIPILKKVLTFAGTNPSPQAFDLIGGFGASRTCLDYAYFNSMQMRGSIKVMLQFFTSTFISGRFSVEYINAELTGAAFESDYTNGLARVINVKGDTVECLTLPYLHYNWWSREYQPQIKISAVSNVATMNATIDPIIFCLVWVAGGEDVQFAFPKLCERDDWPVREASEEYLEYMKKHNERYQAQAAIQQMFEKEKFVPIAENAVYDIDQGLCTSETIGLLTDVCKRYSRMYTNPLWDGDHMFMDEIDRFGVLPGELARYGFWVSFRNTYFGMWRSCFLNRSGGVRWRDYPKGSYNWDLQYRDPGDTSLGVEYVPPFDGTSRLTLPQVHVAPFMSALTNRNYAIDIVKSNQPTSDTRFVYIAARDDLQLGYPILPPGIPAQPTALKGSEERKPFLPKEGRKSVGL